MDEICIYEYLLLQNAPGVEQYVVPFNCPEDISKWIANAPIWIQEFVDRQSKACMITYIMITNDNKATHVYQVYPLIVFIYIKEKRINKIFIISFRNICGREYNMEIQENLKSQIKKMENSSCCIYKLQENNKKILEELNNAKQQIEQQQNIEFLIFYDQFLLIRERVDLCDWDAQNYPKELRQKLTAVPAPDQQPPRDTENNHPSSSSTLIPLPSLLHLSSLNSSSSTLRASDVLCNRLSCPVPSSSCFNVHKSRSTFVSPASSSSFCSSKSLCSPKCISTPFPIRGPLSSVFQYPLPNLSSMSPLSLSQLHNLPSSSLSVSPIVSSSSSTSVSVSPSVSPSLLLSMSPPVLFVRSRNFVRSMSLSVTRRRPIQCSSPYSIQFRPTSSPKASQPIPVPTADTNVWCVRHALRDLSGWLRRLWRG
ncbi:uncharacterized protein LOC130630153 [Hydractinia symbiolongicarpus]|uniref:uncharacterized protein LOC130630153 n=1 Tax=Hydractinia symbiolongicarpus TaxID=13093 RepID=UPI0025518207|nr:uncharacterized protein LOC130630153 [Hydractinia symbiolongicarpus]